MRGLSLLLPLLLSSPVLPAGATVPLTTTSTTREYALVTAAACPSDETARRECTVAATLLVLDKGAAQPSQRIGLEGVMLFLNDQVSPPRWEGLAVALDANLDGREDLALATSQAGPYNSVTFDVFVAGPRRAGSPLALSAELSELTIENMGLFTVDSRRRRLVTSSKGGCCIHSRDEYAFLAAVGRTGGPPVLTLVDHLEEDATFEDHAEIIHRYLVRGVWHSVTRRAPLR